MRMIVVETQKCGNYLVTVYVCNTTTTQKPNQLIVVTNVHTQKVLVPSVLATDAKSHEVHGGN